MRTKPRAFIAVAASIALTSVFGLLLIASTPGIAAPPADPPGNSGKLCGGLAGIECPGNQICIDDPRDNCDPKTGGADCSGICVPRGHAATALGEASADSLEPATEECSFEVGSFESVAQNQKGRGCKPCKKDRRFCECTLNGMPRASCDPCCYTNDIGILVCVD